MSASITAALPDAASASSVRLHRYIGNTEKDEIYDGLCVRPSLDALQPMSGEPQTYRRATPIAPCRRTTPDFRRGPLQTRGLLRFSQRLHRFGGVGPEITPPLLQPRMKNRRPGKAETAGCRESGDLNELARTTVRRDQSTLSRMSRPLYLHIGNLI